MTTSDPTRLRVTFDAAADLYDRARPGYPAALFEELAALAAIGPASRVLEIGCGTGQATVPLAERGCAIVCVELGANLAAVARRKLARFPAGRMEVGAFEFWPLPPVPFDTAVAIHLDEHESPPLSRTTRRGLPMFEDAYSQPDAPDPVLDDALVLALVRRHVPEARAVTAVDESGGEARSYAVDDGLILKVQRPQQLRPRTSLAKEVFFLQQLQSQPAIRVPRVLGYGHEGPLLEYTVMTRMPGRAMRQVPLEESSREQVLMELGKTLRRIHDLPQEPFRASALFPCDASWGVVLARFGVHFAAATRKIGEQARPWSLTETPDQVAAAALAALPPTEQRVALHSNPGPEHTFVFPETGAFAGLIDFGDAYISHPALDLRRRAGPQDRAAILQGYTWERPVSPAFMAVWRVTQVLADLTEIANAPERAAQAAQDLPEAVRRLAE